MREPEGQSSAPLLEGGDSREATALPRTMRSISQSSNDKERVLCDIRNMIIIPEQENKWFTFWEVSVLMLLLVSAYFVPYDVFILQEPEPQIAKRFSRFLDCIFLADIIVNFFTAYEKADQNDGQEWETDKWKIASRYLAAPLSENGKAGWFWIDLCATGPGWLVMVMQGVEGNATQSRNSYHKVATLLRVLRLLRMLRLGRMVERIQNWNVKMGFSLNGAEVGKFLIVTTLTVHWMACLWVAFEGRIYKGVLAQLIELTPSKTWLSELEDDAGDMPCSVKISSCVYLLALYWAIMTLTTVGYGDITPQNTVEFILCCIMMLLMGFVWAYIVGSIVALISNLDKYGNEFKQQMDDLNDMCEDRDVPSELRQTLRTYLMKSKSIPKQTQQRELLASRLSKTLNDKISAHTRGQMLRAVWWAQLDRHGNAIPDDAKLEIVSRMQRRFFGPEENPLQQHMMIFVKEGRVRINFIEISKGQVWGETAILMDQPEIIMSRTLTYVDAFVLTQGSLKEAARQHPTLDVRLRRAQVIMAIWRGLARVKIRSYFQVEHRDRAKQVKHNAPSFACGAEGPNANPEDNTEELGKAVDALADQVKELREAQQRAHEFAKKQLEVTQALAERVETLYNSQRRKN